MPKPDSGSPDQSANQDDAVWLDLVARLEGGSPAVDGASDAADTAGTTRPSGPRDSGTAADSPTAPDAPAKQAGFRDFDPLGLADAAPTELSAAERRAASPAGSVQGNQGLDGATTEGPRDYAVEDDDGAFVPEEPPSLAGTDPLTMLAWLGAVGGPVALLLSVMFWRSAPLLAVLGIVAVFVLAVVYLIMKLPQEKDDDDDGARV
ncbi:hypothetical protein J7E83_12120 [Arthrobacter sp. ISL-48]|uniref:hypothetical protein n=1 Tax=Arthrobacter sp. ISL-48 TaxID=2819110 RepID=UPI001BE7702F|nr:hypothetical protein [Arthrobacter sp. ISL-48]MBT2532855.1 hypothetical protein [Arthrobacter sp. ISL-48]